jgi:predicted nucleic acid-binding protein
LSTAKAELDALWTQVDVVPVTTDLVRAAGELAEIEGLRGCDAVHLAAALTARASVVATADAQLLAAAGRRGLAVSNPSGPTTPER